MQSCVCIYLIYNILIYIAAFLSKSTYSLSKSTYSLSKSTYSLSKSTYSLSKRTYSLVGDNKLSEFCKQCAIYSFENNMSLIIAT